MSQAKNLEKIQREEKKGENLDEMLEIIIGSSQKAHKFSGKSPKTS